MAYSFGELNLIHLICIFIISIIYFLGGVSISKILDMICQKIFREENNYKERIEKYTEKGKLLILLETCIQIGLICILIFIFRFFVNNLIKILCPIHTEKYALLIIAPTVFIKQKILKEKIEYIW